MLTNYTIEPIVTHTAYRRKNYSSRGSNSGPRACEARVITNYTTGATLLQKCFLWGSNPRPLRGPELESGALTTRPQMRDGCKGGRCPLIVCGLAATPTLELAGLAQLVERWSHNPKVVSSILTPGNFAWMNSEGSGLGFQIQGGLTSQWFESTFCAPLFY